MTRPDVPHYLGPPRGMVQRFAMRSLLRTFVFLVALAALAGAAPATAEEAALHVYGPGGPAPAMKEAARAFQDRTGVPVTVTAGPTGEWLDRARADADLVYSGSEHMMTDFLAALDGVLDPATVEPLYLRRSAILVRPGNPEGIRDVPDLGREGLRVLVVQGAGQTGLWEDVAGRTGDVALVARVRRNVAVFAPNTAEARRRWIEDPALDAWVVWDIWHVAHPGLAELVRGSERYAIYRDCGAGLTRRGRERAAARDFLAFLRSTEGEAIFRKWGWRPRSSSP